jgi:hypothetical protein
MLFPMRETCKVGPHKYWDEHCRLHCLSFEQICYGSDAFEEILHLRSLALKTPLAAEPDDCDCRSEHYAVRRDKQLCAAIRITRAQSGLLDCEEFYPKTMLHQLRHLIGSASRFVANPIIGREVRVSQLLIEAGWNDQLSKGIRLDVINVHKRAVRYYGKLGYELVANSFFYHPKWNTPSFVMVFPATPHRETPIKHLFKEINHAMNLQDLIACGVELSDWRSVNTY